MYKPNRGLILHQPCNTRAPEFCWKKQPVRVNITVFCDMTPCSLLDLHQRFGGTCYLLLQEDKVWWSRMWKKVITESQNLSVRTEEKHIAGLGAKTSTPTTRIRRPRRSVFYLEDGSSRSFEALVFIYHTTHMAAMRSVSKFGSKRWKKEALLPWRRRQLVTPKYIIIYQTTWCHVPKELNLNNSFVVQNVNYFRRYQVTRAGVAQSV
jgi:hypothetical protein